MWKKRKNSHYRKNGAEYGHNVYRASGKVSFFFGQILMKLEFYRQISEKKNAQILNYMKIHADVQKDRQTDMRNIKW